MAGTVRQNPEGKNELILNGERVDERARRRGPSERPPDLVSVLTAGCCR